MEKVLVERLLPSVSVITVLLLRRSLRLLFGREVDPPVGQFLRLPSVRLDRIEIPSGTVGTGVVGERQPFPARIAAISSEPSVWISRIGTPSFRARFSVPLPAMLSPVLSSRIERPAPFSARLRLIRSRFFRVLAIVAGILPVLRARSVPIR